MSRCRQKSLFALFVSFNLPTTNFVKRIIFFRRLHICGYIIRSFGPFAHILATAALLCIVQFRRSKTIKISAHIGDCWLLLNILTIYKRAPIIFGLLEGGGWRGECDLYWPVDEGCVIFQQTAIWFPIDEPRSVQRKNMARRGKVGWK